MPSNNLKMIRIKGDSLKAIKQVMNETNRNITCAAEYLIKNGLLVFLNEQKCLNELKSIALNNEKNNKKEDGNSN